MLRDTDLGESVLDGGRCGEGRLPDGDALYRGGVIVSFKDVAIGVMSDLSKPIKSRWIGVKGMSVRGRDRGRTSGRMDVMILNRNNPRKLHEMICITNPIRGECLTDRRISSRASLASARKAMVGTCLQSCKRTTTYYTTTAN